MTYCVGLKLDRGLVFMADTRTNSGVDNISVFRKMHTWSSDDRVITLLTAGNLATTQSVVSQLDERSKAPEDRNPSIFELPTMFRVAQHIGDTLRNTIAAHANENGQQADAGFNATMVVGGQIAGMEPRLFLLYPEGNFIEATGDTPFLQIGEMKYGRPILVRAYDPAMSFEDAVKLLLVSFDSTVKANLSVGLPLDLSIYATDSLEPGPSLRIAADDPYYRAISSGWGDALRTAFDSLPTFEF